MINKSNFIAGLNDFKEGANNVWNRIVEKCDEAIPQPHITVWMNKDEDPSKRFVDKIWDTSKNYLTIGVIGAVAKASLVDVAAGFAQFGAVIAVGLLDIGKAWVINKLMDNYSDEQKKVVDSAVSVVIAIAYLVASIAIPVLGPVVIASAIVHLTLTTAMFVRACRELRAKQPEPAETEMTELS